MWSLWDKEKLITLTESKWTRYILGIKEWFWNRQSESVWSHQPIDSVITFHITWSHLVAKTVFNFNFIPIERMMDRQKLDFFYRSAALQFWLTWWHGRVSVFGSSKIIFSRWRFILSFCFNFIFDFWQSKM